jgi:hypothetical protein
MDLLGRTSSRRRRALLFSLSALMVGAPCCGGGDTSRPSQVQTLRIVSVTASEPYAEPGDTVTLRMTYADALGAAGDGDEPRPIQVTWLGGCFNPIGGAFEACFPQIEGVLRKVASGMADPSGLVKQEIVSPEQSGVADAVSFDLTVPEDVLAKKAQIAESGTPYATAYVFFIACAGTVRPAEVTPEEGLGFPLACVDDKGKTLNADNFVVGYTQIYVFGDGRKNDNPQVRGITLDGAEIASGAENAPTVERCASAPNEEMNAGCGQPAAPTECKSYKIAALVDDVAEADVESSVAEKRPIREAIWVDYFADGGAFDGAKKLVSDTEMGYRPEHGTTWTPPSKAGLVTLWTVVHDARGGASVAQRVVRVE